MLIEKINEEIKVVKDEDEYDKKHIANDEQKNNQSIEEEVHKLEGCISYLENNIAEENEIIFLLEKMKKSSNMPAQNSLLQNYLSKNWLKAKLLLVQKDCGVLGFKFEKFRQEHNDLINEFNYLVEGMHKNEKQEKSITTCIVKIQR